MSRASPKADPERCPVCGRAIERTEQRGDVTAYVHDDHQFDCLK